MATAGDVKVKPLVGMKDLTSVLGRHITKKWVGVVAYSDVDFSGLDNKFDDMDTSISSQRRKPKRRWETFQKWDVHWIRLLQEGEAS